MRGTGQSAFTHAKLHIKARKTLGEAPKTAAEGKSLNPGWEFKVESRLILAESGYFWLRDTNIHQIFSSFLITDKEDKSPKTSRMLVASDNGSLPF